MAAQLPRLESSLDYFVQGFCKLNVNRAPHNTNASLLKIREVIGNIDRDTVARANGNGDGGGKLQFFKIEIP